ncbi:MAG: hypothetical protein ACI4QH_02925, partial [Candidatus Fimimonas sp.]
MKDFKELLDGIAGGEKFTTLLKYATNVIATFALYVTIVLAVALVVWAIVVRNKDEQYLAGVRKTMKGIVIGYSVGVIAIIGSLRFLRDYIKGDITWHVWLVVGLVAFIIVGAVVVALLHKKQIKAYKWVALAMVVAALAVTIVLLFVVKPMQEDWGDGEFYTYDPQKPVLMYVISAVLVAAIAVLALLGEKPSDYNTKSLTYAAICIAASFALSYVKFFSLPQGG